jgi:hypothetical protein
MSDHGKAAPPTALTLTLDPAALEPLIRATVEATVARLEFARATLDDRLAYGEAEAARLLGLEPYVLRDERLRERITASSIVGRRIRYTKRDLLDYLASRRTTTE